MRYLLDTHAWLWWHMEPNKCTANTLHIIEKTSAQGGLLLSAITPWEFCKLLEKGRLKISLQGNDWMRMALANLPVNLIPITPEIAWQSTTLPAPFHEDLADQIIVATARIEQAIIISCDKLLHKYSHVQTIW